MDFGSQPQTRSVQNTMRISLAMVFVTISLPAYADSSCSSQVNEAFAKLRETKSFRLETTIVNPQQGTLHMKADYILPDRMHQTITLGSDGTAAEMIVIGKDAWSNQGAGWAKLPDKFASTVAKQLKETVADAPKVDTKYECLGDKSFEGHTYDLYQGTLASPLSADSKQAGPRISALTVPKMQSVYIDKQTGLPVRNIVTPVTEPNNRLFDGTFTVIRDLTIDRPTTAQN
jgi:hypothetical protein